MTLGDPLPLWGTARLDEQAAVAPSCRDMGGGGCTGLPEVVGGSGRAEGRGVCRVRGNPAFSSVMVGDRPGLCLAKGKLGSE
jgi:hypothetical protein